MAAGTVSRASRLASVVAWVTPSPASKPRAPTAPEPVPTWGIKYDKPYASSDYSKYVG